MADRWHSVDEVAEHLGIAPDTVYRWILRRNMPAHRIGRLWKFKVNEVDEWVRIGGAREDHEASSDDEAPTKAASATRGRGPARTGSGR